MKTASAILNSCSLIVREFCVICVICGFRLPG
jgi:hypothetical protein